MTAYADRIARIHQDLGIPDDYAVRYRLSLCHEESDLLEAGRDIYGRKQRLYRATAGAWRRMRETARSQAVVLELVSAYRSVEYQRAIFARKLGSGQPLEEILGVNAAPGYSEHHTGRAIDLTTSGLAPLEVDFERSPAFDWLVGNAAEFDFSMTYPRNNHSGIAFEPWHWAHCAEYESRTAIRDWDE